MAIEGLDSPGSLRLWHYFSQICDIARPSKHEGRIISYLEEFAAQQSLRLEKDSVGNVLILKEGTEGRRDEPAITLQAHMDMVAEKDSAIEFNFLCQPINAYIEDGWVRARGTTLGADCGIGMAVMLALLEDDNLSHPPIEALFTVDEETGLTGAFALSDKMLKGRYLINVDSEDSGEIFIGCAGGVDTLATFNYTKEVNPYKNGFRITLSSLTGGHSGDDIDKKRANANVLMCRLLNKLMCQIGCELSYIDGGNLRNAIARDCVALIAVDDNAKDSVQCIVDRYEKIFKKEYSVSEPCLKLTIEQIDAPQYIIKREDALSIVEAVFSSVDGVVAMSQQIDGFVESSTNLASIKQNEKQIVISTSQRSSLESKKVFISTQMALHFNRFGATVRHSDGYPGWNPQTDTHLLKVAVTTHEKVLGYRPKVRAIHAGLECGLIKEKYPCMEMISIGPTIRGAHSPSERLSIKDTNDFWNYIVETLKQI